MEQKRNTPRPDNRRPRRKKKKRPDRPEQGGAPLPKQQGGSVRNTAPQGKRPPPSSHQDRRKEGGREKSPRAGGIAAAPRDLRLGSPQRDKKAQPEPPFQHTIRRYGIAFYDSFAAAKADHEQIASKAREFDQLNLVIRAEGNMDDPELLALGPVKIFAGAAWTLIHERRVQEGWYESPR